MKFFRYSICIFSHELTPHLLLSWASKQEVHVHPVSQTSWAKTVWWGELLFDPLLFAHSQRNEQFLIFYSTFNLMERDRMSTNNLEIYDLDLFLLYPLFCCIGHDGQTIQNPSSTLSLSSCTLSRKTASKNNVSTCLTVRMVFFGLY